MLNPIVASVIGVLALAPGRISIAQGDALVLKSNWKSVLPSESRRIAVADVAGDGKARIVVIGKEKELGVFKINGDTAEKEAAIQLASEPNTLVAGRFAKDKPAVIVVPGAVYFKEGDKYSTKSTDLQNITGSVRFSDGTESVFFFGGSGEPESWAVDLTGPKAMVQGRAMPDPTESGDQYAAVIAHIPGDFMRVAGFPEEATRIGTFGFMAPKAGVLPVGYVPWHTSDGAFITTFDIKGLHPGAEGLGKNGTRTAKLAGNVLDLAIGPDPKIGKQFGIYALLATGADGKGRSIEFFAWERP